MRPLVSIKPIVMKKCCRKRLRNRWKGRTDSSREKESIVASRCAHSDEEQQSSDDECGSQQGKVHQSVNDSQAHLSAAVDQTF